jgi:hypothetical protein
MIGSGAVVLFIAAVSQRERRRREQCQQHGAHPGLGVCGVETGVGLNVISNLLRR